MKLLILGGTVFLSKEIGRQAIERGHEVTVAARGESGEPPPGAQFIRIDRTDPSTLEPLRGREFDAVVDVARIPAHVAETLEVLGDNVGHYTLVSSISVYADHSEPGKSAQTAETLEPIEADFAEPPGDAQTYGRSKVTVENLVRDKYGDRAFIPRPGLIIGPHDDADRFGYWPWRIAQGGEILAPSADALVQWIDVRDLASWIIGAAERKYKGTYDAICEPIAWSDFLSQIAKAVGTDPEFVYTNSEFLLEQGVNPWAGEESLGMWVPDSMAGMTGYDGKPARDAALHIRPLSETVAGWQETNTEADLQAKLSPEKESAVIAAWKART
ncbi:NAD-dependent epimerase/dehydratase family protein [Natronoglycomyces albus]|uniref:NAD-dependent epimerase/dehydratase family protein n=1 Tax=Natronoglycomyces albus TaxID=2811108 RepID=A0A895XSR2_9ACTN|nr:NAD-dependent epimerase/dehydratase family protein [Natronoglycomyces albus]QSB06359.1 NAD-dependent epimerase/dehydratase family protein [Natronoglycomyces albus]